MSVINSSECYRCSETISSKDKISCDRCRRSLHSKCSGLARSVCTAVLAENSCLLFVCDDCKNSVQNVNNDIGMLKDLILSVKKELTDLFQTSIPSVTIDKVDVIECAIKEINDRNNRSKNIIIHNVPESTSPNVEDRKRHDKDLVSKLLGDAYPNDVLPNFLLFRLGRPLHDKVRPIKVVFSSSDVALNYLNAVNTSAKKYKSPTMASRDRTPQERNYLRKLRDELQTRMAKGETNITIRYVCGSPAIVNTQKN